MSEPEREDPEAARRNARIGLALFAVYCLLYGGFVLLNAFAPQAMELTLWGVNLAILYGMGLIVAAFLLALLYAWLCRANPQPESSRRSDASLRASEVPPQRSEPRE